MLKVLLMHLFITLLINKTTGSNNRHFLFNTLKNENKEEFRTGSTFSTFELIKKIYYGSGSLRMLSPNFHLNKHGLYFKFILLLSRDIKLSPGPTTPKGNDTLWELLPFFVSTTIDFLLSRWVISLIPYL